MNIKSTRRVVGLLTLPTLALSLTACGGGSDAKSSAPGTVASQSSSANGSGGSQSGQPAPATKTVTVKGADANTSVPQTAAVPADCDMPAQRLSGGQTSASQKPKQGSVVTDGAAPLLIDMAGRGSKQVLWRYSCSAGNVEWPDVIVLSDAKGNLVGDVDLGPIAQTEHADVTKWSISGNNVVLDWKAYEGAGFDIQNHHSTLTWSGGKLQLKDGGAQGASPNANVPSGAAPGAGGPRPSNATPLTESYSDQYSSMPAFKTPSGSNGCQVDQGWVRCGSQKSGEFFLDTKGNVMDQAPADDAPMWPQADTLAYGQVRYNGDTVFASTKQGVTVWNTKTGHGALINTSGVQQF